MVGTIDRAPHPALAQTAVLRRACAAGCAAYVRTRFRDVPRDALAAVRIAAGETELAEMESCAARPWSHSHHRLVRRSGSGVGAAQPASGPRRPSRRSCAPRE